MSDPIEAIPLLVTQSKPRKAKTIDPIMIWIVRVVARSGRNEIRADLSAGMSSTGLL